MQKTAKRILSLALVLAMMLGLSITAWADEDGGSDGLEETTEQTTGVDLEPASITLSPKTLDLDVGDTKDIDITVSGTGGQAIDWRSSDDSVATVLGGRVTAVGAGTATITASVAGVSDKCTVHVTKLPELPPLHADTTPQSIVMTEGDTQTLSADPTGGTGSFTYSWYSTNSGIVSISSTSGKTITLTGVSGGTASIVLTVTDMGTNQTDTANCSVTVNAKAKPTATTYNATASAAVGSDLSLNTVANAIAGQFQRDLGETLGYGADVRFGTASNTYGSLRFGNGGDLIAANSSYSFAVFQDMIFEPASAGTFTTSYTATQGDLTISGTISISVTGGAKITGVTMSPTSVELATYSSRYLSLSVTPSSLASSAAVSWTTSNPNVATVSGSGLSATVNTYGRAGNATITATVTDSTGTKLQATCAVYVTSSTNYNPTLTVTLGSDYYGTDTSNNMARQFYDVYGRSLNYNNAVIRFSSTGNTNVGVLRLSNGQAISANYNYTFSEWVNNIHFEPVSVGTFSIPYTLNYNGDTLSGTFSIYVRGASLSVTMSPASMSLATYSNQYLSLNITPKNAYYTVTWSSSNTNIATVSGSGASVTVNTKGTAGTATISASVRDANGVVIVKNCTVTVTSSAAYNPSVSTTLGVPYTGTGTSTAMIQQFRTLYGVTLNNNNAKIRFSSTGNNNIATMRLSNGAAVKANTDYTMTQYIAMYTDPVATGTFTIPYTLTYNSKSLTGNVSVVINPNTVNVGVNLNSKDAYAFSSASANGRAGSSLLGDTITNAVGKNWSYLRFNATTSSVGTLYANTSRAAVANTNIGVSNLGSLYFVPTAGGTYSIGFTVYSSAGSTLATGTLSIIVNAPAAAAAISFYDVSPTDPSIQWAVDAVNWAVSREITNGMGTNSAGQPQFKPNDTCNKAHILTFLWRSQGKPAPTISNPFTDVKSSDYFYNAAIWAYEKGLVTGRTFGETTPCTRAMAVTYMWRLAGQPSAAASGFGDVPGSGETASAVAWAVANGVTNGAGKDATGQPVFSPNSTCTRGQIVTFLYRAYA